MSASKTPRQRVVVTGMGCLTPLGLDLTTTWDAACAGHSGVGPISRLDAADYPVRLAAELPAQPEPRNVAKKKPSPPKNIDFKLPARSMSYSMPGVNAAKHPVSTRKVSPFNSFSTTVPPMWIKHIPSPRNF